MQVYLLRIGRHAGWVVERTVAHLNQMRRLTTRYERRADICAAFLTPGCALLAFGHLARLCHGFEPVRGRECPTCRATLLPPRRPTCVGG